MSRRAKREEELKECVEAGCLVEFLGRKHMVPIIFIFYENQDRPLRYNQIYKRLVISPKTLSERLKELDIMGIVTRKAYNEIPPRVEYRITEKGLSLGLIFKSLEKWATNYEHLLGYPHLKVEDDDEEVPSKL